MEASRPSFMDSGRSRGYPEEGLDILWNTLVPFADYSFNKSHATGYALLAYETAYLKAHHPKTFMAALLSSVDTQPFFQYGKPTKKQNYINEVIRMGIRILPPDINQSQGTWTATEEGIRYGLSAIKGVGDKAFNALISKRPYKDLDDFLMRVPAKGFDSGVIGSLAKSGSLDSLVSGRREALVDGLESLVEAAGRKRDARKTGQGTISRNRISLGGGSERQLSSRRTWEKELLGLELSHPGYRLHLPQMDPTRFAWLKRVIDGIPGGSNLTLVVAGHPTPFGGRVDLSASTIRLFEENGIRVEEL